VDNLVNMLTYSMGGPSIDAGAFSGDNNSNDIIRYTPPIAEFEVVTLHIDPGQTLNFPNPQHPSVLIILEGSGELDGEPCRPGQSFYWPSSAAAEDNDDDDDALVLTVHKERRGPMKCAIAHQNTNMARPTAVNREDFGASSSSSHATIPETRSS
jgi:mannose-6-phosphate isomerase